MNAVSGLYGTSGRVPGDGKQIMGPLKPDTDGLSGLIFISLRFLIIQIFNCFMVP